MKIYDQLWAQAEAALARGQPQVDRHLLDRKGDARRGVSLVFQPSQKVQAQVKTLTDELAPEFPGQYFYRPEELHVTVLTLISACDRWRSQMRDVARFRSILREALHHEEPFAVRFHGVTAAPDAVMIQGFAQGDGLERIRNKVRQVFGQNGFGDRLDHRYRCVTAHLTAMRFAKSSGRWQRLLAMLSANREREFGNVMVDTLQIVWGDWYGSRGNRRVLEQFRLRRSGSL